MATHDLKEIVENLTLQCAAAAQSCFRRARQIIDDPTTPTARTRDGVRLVESGTAIVKILVDDQRKRDELARGEGKPVDFTDAELDSQVNKLLVTALATMTPEERAALEAPVAVD